MIDAIPCPRFPSRPAQDQVDCFRNFQPTPGSMSEEFYNMIDEMLDLFHSMNVRMHVSFKKRLFGLNNDFDIPHCYVSHFFLVVNRTICTYLSNDPLVHSGIHSYMHSNDILNGKSSLQFLLLRNTSVKLCLVVQDCSIFIANVLEILQSCTKPLILYSEVSSKICLRYNAFLKLYIYK